MNPSAPDLRRDPNTISKSAPFPLHGAQAARFRALVDEHFDFVWRNLRRLGVSEADSDDAAQEVFLVAARRLDDLRPGCERAFLFGTALRRAARVRRSARRKPEQLLSGLDEQQAFDPNPEELSERSHARRVLARVLGHLSREQRSVLVLCEIEELSGSAVAELLEIPLGTVKSRLRGARKALHCAARRALDVPMAV